MGLPSPVFPRDAQANAGHIYAMPFSHCQVVAYSKPVASACVNSLFVGNCNIAAV